MLKVCEIFYSIQGEGKYIGTPSVFVRFFGCNLQCKGFGVAYKKDKQLNYGCDSYYAVDSFFDNYDIFTSSRDLIDKINSLHKSCNVVFSGGEPTLHYKNSILYDTVKHLLKHKRHITFETNGTVNIDFKEYSLYKKCCFAMSIKLSNSKEKYHKRVQKSAIDNIIKNTKDSFFKFTIDKNNLNGYKKEIEDITNKTNNKIYCMPLGDTKEKLQENDKAVFDFCLENNYNYSDRIHIRLFGKKRGV